MALEWFRRERSVISPEQKKTSQDTLWVKCDSCGEIVFKKELEKLQLVCPKCSFHFAMPAEDYIDMLADKGTWIERDGNLRPQDPLGFKDSKKYSDRVVSSIKSTGKNDAITIGSCEVNHFPVELGIMEFSFMGGSVGSVVGEKISRAVDQAIDERRALILVSRSGGMRMQEGMVSLMQMAKTSVKLTQLDEAGLPYISVITNPTTGGTTASFSMLGDIIIAEPGALIGFAGPRVIKQTIGQDLPPGFQRSEFLLEKGFLDRIVKRNELKPTITHFLKAFMPAPAETA
ncbi:MAG: acetyl-CoA carboxylase carboxyltransferase subunit beta [Calditrichaeota bacterium]|nr:acetyl-CoA carboxylase carboxyltransferase subunit beta [Calditrichota bacterium]MCB9368160.1 acetyl-CoA carboxylase carboxyltransferase subunit beta [Calditrichota bacterium]